MKNEICENCGTEIGKLERAFVFEGNIICEKCQKKLRTDLTNGKQSAITKLGKVTAIAYMRLGAGVCNILAGLVFCWLILPIAMIPLGIVEIISASNFST
jgi:hypothetical protein